MQRVNQIFQNKKYQKHIKRIRKYEKKRKFCRHDMEHIMSVARIAYILNLELNLGIDKEIIYGTALLHDVGRDVQYKDGTPHEAASAKIAPVILKKCGYTEEEIMPMVEAIENHRNDSIKDELSLRGILFRADKLSRNCFACDVTDECNWKGDKKNERIVW